MPGIYGLIGATDPADALRRMTARATRQPWYRTGEHVDAEAGLAMACTSLGLAEGDERPATSKDGALVAVMTGELYDPAGRAETLLRGYAAEGKDFLRRLDGKFSAAIWDAARGRLVLVGDRFGMKPLYYARLPGRLLFASEIKALLADPEVSRRPNLRGLAQFFTFGQYLAEDTSLEAVRVLPAAGWLTYDAAEDRLTVERYHDHAQIEPHADWDPADWLGHVDEAFSRAVARRTGGEERLGLALSGGLDARTILGVADHERVKLTTVTLGVEGSADHRSAAALAGLVGCRHHAHVLGDDFLADFRTHFGRMVRLTDGQYLSQAIVIPTLALYRELGIDVLMRGHAGELMHMTKAYNFSLDRRALALRTGEELEAWALGRLRAFMLEGLDRPLWAAEHAAAMDGLARESLQECLAESAGMGRPAQRIAHLFLNQRVRRESALSLVKFGSVVETRLPYLDNELVDLLLACPVEVRLGETIQRHILRRRRPEFLAVPNVNTGTRVGAGRVARRLASLRQRVLAKLQVRGYQPYEKMGLWLRRELRPLVETLLLDDRCLQRGIFDPDAVRGLVGQHVRNERNHTFLILAMMIYELGQREIVDQEIPA